MHDADKHHVPVGARPTLPITVARDPLLLAPGIDIAVHQRIRHPAPARPAAMLVEDQVASHVHAPQRHRLRDGPLHRAARRLYREPFRSSPERRRRVVVLMIRICVHVACNSRCVRRRAQPHHLGVESDRNVNRIASGRKQQRIALRAKLVVPLRRIHRIDLLLDRLRCHRRIENQNIGSELRLRALCGKRWQSHCQQSCREAPTF